LGSINPHLRGKTILLSFPLTSPTPRYRKYRASGQCVGALEGGLWHPGAAVFRESSRRCLIRHMPMLALALFQHQRSLPLPAPARFSSTPTPSTEQLPLVIRSTGRPKQLLLLESPWILSSTLHRVIITAPPLLRATARRKKPLQSRTSTGDDHHLLSSYIIDCQHNSRRGVCCT